MQLAHIFPIANQKLYKNETYVMILAHLVKDGLYDPANFSEDQYIIMDNGLYEKAQVSTSLQDCIDLAEQSGIPIKEIIIPDAVNDSVTTKKLFLENLETVKKWQNKYKFMFVAQATTYDELNEMIDFINEYDLNLAVGISKLSPLNRGSKEAVAAYVKCRHPIHVLGAKNSFKELLPICNVVRGCDTSQVAFIVKNEKTLPDDLVSYVRNGIDIDLAVDEYSSLSMAALRQIVNTQLRKYEALD